MRTKCIDPSNKRKFNENPCSYAELSGLYKRIRMASFAIPEIVGYKCGIETYRDRGDAYRSVRGQRLMLHWWMRGLQAQAWECGFNACESVLSGLCDSKDAHNPFRSNALLSVNARAHDGLMSESASNPCNTLQRDATLCNDV